MPLSSTFLISTENSNVAEHAVVNASPLIFLSRAGLLDLLQLISSEIIVPEIVASEIDVRGKNDPTVKALANTVWLLVTQTPPVPPQIQAWGLGPGESSVLAWAHGHPGSEAIIDDLAGRRCAAAFNIPVRGTLGLALIAKQRGHIPSARRVLEQLRQGGMYLSDRVMNEALELVAE
jgi:predicted nucleic acid-binding protein